MTSSLVVLSFLILPQQAVQVVMPAAPKQAAVEREPAKAQSSAVVPGTPDLAAAKTFAAEFREDFNSAALDRKLFQSNGSAESIVPANNGLTIKIAKTANEPVPVSIGPNLQIFGDFEVSAAFELPAQIVTKKEPIGVALKVTTKATNPETFAIGRFHRLAEGHGIFAQINPGGPEGGKSKSKDVQVKSEKLAGTLMLRRTGRTLQFLFADAGSEQFIIVQQHDIGKTDIQRVSLETIFQGAAGTEFVRWKWMALKAESIPNLGATIRTITDQLFLGKPTRIEGGKLVVGTDPPRTVPFDEVLRVDLGATAGVAANWVGQDNSDFIGGQGTRSANKIQDVHLILTGLDTKQKIRQIVALSSDEETDFTWKFNPDAKLLDSFDSGEISHDQDWKKITDVRTAPLGTSFARVRMIAVRRRGRTNDAFIDALSLKPENGANLLKNPGCESPVNDGTPSDWTKVGDGKWQRKEKDPAPAEGKAYFAPGDFAKAELKQDVDLSKYATEIMTGNLKFVFDASVMTRRSNPPDTAQLIVEYWESPQTPSWPLFVQRNGLSDRADLYLEPSGDMHQKELILEVAYESGARKLCKVVGMTHTDAAKQVVGTNVPQGQSPANTASASQQFIIHLDQQDRISGELLSMDKTTLKVRAGWGSVVEVPLVQVLAIQRMGAFPKDGDDQFKQRLAKPGSQDVVFVEGKDKDLSVLQGTAGELSSDKLQLTYEGESRNINRSRLLGIIYATRPSVRQAFLPHQVFRLQGGDRISGIWQSIGPTIFQIQPVWGGSLDLPSNAVSEVNFRNGKLVYLSDIEPVSVEEISYFGHKSAYRRDLSYKGDPIRLGPKIYRKGLATHSKTVLSYAVEGQFERFTSIVGFDPTVRRGTGRAAIRVLGDGRELFSEPDLRSSQPPKIIDVKTVGVKLLTLEIDFGEEEDIGDRILWGNAGLIRPSKS